LLGLIREQSFSVENIRMKPNDILILYTDGISEAMDQNGNIFGEERICELVKKYKDESAKHIAYMIIEHVQKFNANSKYNDDKTIVVVKRRSVENPLN
jgi:sigma-B regulation protein RsbU (phosphoserine phosphatase)